MIRVLADSIADAYSSISSRLLHSTLTSLGAMVGVGALVLTLGLTTTLRAQVSARFDALAATELRLDVDRLSDLPTDFDSRLRHRPGVKRTGRLYQVTAGDGRVGRLWADQRLRETFPVFAIDVETLDIARAAIRGPGMAEWMAERGEQVVLLGRAVAQELGYEAPGLRRPDLIFVGGRPLAVVGTISDVARHPELMSALVIPVRTAQKLEFIPAGGISLYVETEPGAAQVVSHRAAAVVRPENPSAVRVIAPPNPRSLRRAIDDNIAALLLALAGVSLALGGIEIGTSMLVSVIGRVNEIGLRRALGSSRGRIALLFLLESATIGTLGGVIGAAVGSLAVSGLSLAQGWQAVVDPQLPVLAVLFGTFVGLAAGGYPAFRASQIEPAEALRR
jgi:putative ABC transport system permease protein